MLSRQKGLVMEQRFHFLFDVVRRTRGVSAALIQEKNQRSVQLHIESGGNGEIASTLASTLANGMTNGFRRCTFSEFC